MSTTLLQDLATQAAPKLALLAGAQVVAWTGKLVDMTSTQLIPLLPPEIQGLVAAALETVKANSQLIESTTEHGFTALVSHLAMGQEDQARLVWLASAAPVDAALDQLDRDSAATRADTQSRQDTWASIKQVGLDFLEAGGKAALPMLLAFLPV